jgi:superfamily I DNA/RNA helicase
MIGVEQWAPADGLALEPNALAAAREVNRNLALTAGPGAGKTEMLAQRADFLLRTGQCRYPKRILAISFKVDASQNLKARVRKRCGSDLAARFDSFTFHAFAKRIIDRFRIALTGQDALDADYTIGPQRIRRRAITFADMVPLAVEIVQSNALPRRAIRQTYSHVFLDEFQDCTQTQYELIRACFLGTDSLLTAVGDTKQRIMGWAGALEGIFETYAQDFNARSLNLYQNFRSKMRLRRMQNAMVRVMDPPAALDERDLLGDEGEIEIIRLDSDEAEAQVLAELVRTWIEVEEIEPAEIAILVSRQQNLYCLKLCAALRAAGVPFREEDGTQDLAAEPIAKLIVDFLLVASGSREPAPYKRLLELVVFGHDQDDEREYRARSRWARLIADVRLQVLAGTSDLANLDDLTGIVGQLIERLGRDALVAMSADYERGNRLQELIDATITRAYRLITASGDALAALGSFAGDRSVKIMSIHKSKGLEFDSVIVLGVERETFWGNQDAERSGFFVAISRAKRRLYLTVAGHRDRPPDAPRWTCARNEHPEFIGYALPFVSA